MDCLISLPSLYFLTFLLIGWYFNFIVIWWCVVANFSILERFEIKRPPKLWLSQYVYNKHNTTWKVLCMVFAHLFLYQKSLLIAVIIHLVSYVNNSCINTVRPHSPWSILYEHTCSIVAQVQCFCSCYSSKWNSGERGFR